MGITTLCRKVGMTAQNYYKARRQRKHNEVDECFIKELVQAERQLQPRLGGRKMYGMLNPEMQKAGIIIGRDRFFKVLKTQGLLLERLPKAPQTTNSHHNLPVFTNLIREMTLTAPNQVWASDITYIRTGEGFSYLSLITDMYSRKIVGWHLADGLKAEDTLKALEMALRERPEGANPIHHSDRGSQYCSHLYVNRLKENKMAISMTEDNHCAENALAERVNGILKQEYGLGYEFRNVAQALKSVQQAIYLYNNRRPHMSLKMKTPAQVHRLAA